jgi:RNA polymerase sigma-70 factor (ECF subfamily)
LEELCRTYWFPIYAFIRRRGSDPHQAEDLTQSFFVHILENEALAKADRRKGKFRSFLLSTLNHFLSNELDKQLALKRGGGRQFVSFDDETGESNYLRVSAESLSPEKLFDRRWALILVEKALARLRGEYAAAGNSNLFSAIEPGLTEDVAPPKYSEWATRLGMTPGAVRVALHRLRRRFGEALRSVVSDTVSTPEEVEEEIRALFASVAK